MPPRVSVIMAVHDGARHLDEAMASGLGQTLDDLELVVIDDGSTDGTAELLADWQRRDRRVRVERRAHAGLAASLNRAAGLAHGRYLARQDADDVSRPERLALQLAHLDRHARVAALGSAAEIIDVGGAVVGELRVPCGPPRVRAALQTARATPVHGSMVMRREAFEAVGGYREAFAVSQDFDLWLRMAERDDLDNLAQRLYRWRRNPAGISARARERQLRYSGVAMAFAAERARHGDDSCALLARTGGDLDAFAAGYRERGRLHALWGELLYRGLNDARLARRHFSTAVAHGWLRPRTLALLGWSCLGLGWPRRRGDVALAAGAWRPRVVMVTGAYWPEVSGAGVQCRQLVRALAGQAEFAVVTTSRDASLPRRAEVDGVPVRRIAMTGRGPLASARAALALAAAFRSLAWRADLIHLHGFSRKSALLSGLAALAAVPVLLKLTSVGEDDPRSMRGRGLLTGWWYRRADAFVGVSPRMRDVYLAEGLPPERFHLIANGVDVARFRPVEPGEAGALRQALGLGEEGALVLFVGHFSRDKQPHLLFEAWSRLAETPGLATTLVFLGTTRAGHFEVDATLVAKVRADAERRGLDKHVHFVEWAADIDRYYRAATVFVLPSRREGLPNALLEAMASGLPCIASRLPGITDTVVEDGVSGRLVEPGDAAALERALRGVLADPVAAAAMGARARQTVVARYAMAATAREHLELYRRLGRRR